MKFSEPLISGRLIKRYKRFLADVRLDTGEVVTVHCTNSGAMLSCLEENAPVMLSMSKNPKRKTAFTWEMILMNGHWIGINTQIPNILAKEWLKSRILPQFPEYNMVRREVQFLDSRFDIYAENKQEKCFVEVKNVTYKYGDYAIFPDAKTTRGQKHLKTLLKVKEAGYRAVMLYVIQRVDVDFFAAAQQIDPVYAALMQDVYQKGIELIPVRVKVSPKEIVFDKNIPLKFSIDA